MRKTFNLFILSFSIIFLTLFVAAFWDSWGLGENKIPLALSITISFGISIAGLILGIIELKSHKAAKTIIGLIGHLIIFIFLFVITAYALTL